MSDENSDDGDKSDSEIIKDCEQELQRMQESQEFNWSAAEGSKEINNNQNSRGMKRLRDISEGSSEEGFITVTRNRKLKRLIRSDSLSDNKSVESMEQEGSCEKIEVCLTSAEVLPKQMALAKMLRNENILNIMKIHYKNPYKIFIQFSDKVQAENLIKCEKLAQLGVRAQLTSELTLSYGIVKGVDLETSEKELLDSLTSSFKITSVKRLKRMDPDGNWVNSETVRICFNSRSRPSFVFAYGCRFPVERYIFPVNQCSNCWKFGHIKRFCPRKSIVCPKCGNHHMNCETITFSCPNCKGPHMALDKSCKVYLKEKEIRSIMGDKDLSYKEAYEVFLSLAKEKHENPETANTISQKEYPKTVDNCEYANRQSHINTYADVVRESTSSNRKSSEEKETEHDKSIRRKNGNTAGKKNSKQHTDPDFSIIEIENEITDRQQRLGEEVSEKKEKKKKKVQYLMQKIEEIVLCENKTFLEKIIFVFKFIYEECKSYFVNMFCGGGVLQSIFKFLDG
ncbi:uncharacterized protein LOC126911796 [Spodoptera frugiperda]|uniref:Uncharacterized protein LOC126911796 n=1 Tax=Spodoptera frugiperda TaxID=7108 RepID=A0A9R0EZ47_SPOFR|nr:uncharacterized protein LOC126911796 [Spodoptera frugiperda]